MTSVITRFPPSPTGPLHMGNVRSALFNYFFARQNNGKFIVRVEDTDRARSKKEYEEDMLDSLIWLGVSRDGDVWRQSERTDVYKSYLDKLIAEDKAYISIETEGENKEVVRFRNPNKAITFTDIIRGEVTFDTTELGDFIVARNINEPIYHLTVVVDDFETGVTHVIRGEDHISNTPRQILIQEAIGAPRPLYAHLPLMLAEDKSKLSKRKHGEAVSLRYYRERGYLPEAVVNLLALTGWNPGTDQEILSMDELIAQFKLENVQKGGAVFNVEKLNWMNREYIKRLPDDVRRQHVREFAPSDIPNEILWKLEPIIIDRINAFGEIPELFTSGEFDYVIGEPSYDVQKLVWKDSTTEDTKKHLTHVLELFRGLSEDDFGSSETVKAALWPYADEHGRGAVLWPLRYALTGKDKSPDPFTCATLIGKEATIERVSRAVEMLE